MTKQLMLEGFIIRPIAHAVDIEGGTIEPISLGEQKITLAEMPTFTTEQWPMMWASLQAQFAADQQAQADAAAAADAAAPRPARRRAAREAGKVKAVSDPE